MIYYRASYPGFLRTVVRLFDSRELAEQWVQKLGVRKVATVDMFSTLENDTTQPQPEEEWNRNLKKNGTIMDKNRKIEALLQSLYGQCTPAELVENILTELRHLAEARGLDWERVSRRSASHWHAERTVQS